MGSADKLVKEGKRSQRSPLAGDIKLVVGNHQHGSWRRHHQQKIDQLLQGSFQKLGRYLMISHEG